MRLRLAVFAALFAASCTLRAPRIDGSGTPCTTDGECDGGVCYATLCRARAQQLGTIYAEVHAPDPQLGILQRSGIDPRQNPTADFQLAPVINVAGHVYQSLGPPPAPPAIVPSAEVVFTDTSDAGIPGRVATASTLTDSSAAFSTTLAAASWSIVVRPPGLPPSLDAGQLSATNRDLLLVIPAPADLVSVDGGVTSGGAPLDNVTVVATTADGVALSPATLTKNDGGFGLVLPPQTTSYYVQLGPQNDTDLIPLFSPVLVPPNTSPSQEVGTLPEVTTLIGRVVDSNGAPIPSVNVRALRTNLTAPISWTLQREANADLSGVFNIFVRAGDYVVQAVPGPNPAQPAMSGEVAVTGVAGISFDMGTVTCPAKARATGKIVRPDGTAATAGFQILASRTPKGLLATQRPRVTSITDDTGTYELVADAGEYRVSVLPPPDTGLPITYATLELRGTGMPEQLADIHVPHPVTMLGTVYGVGQVPVTGATVDFYAVNSALAPNQQQAVLIGSALTDSTGGYRAVLPDVADPTAP